MAQLNLNEPKIEIVTLANNLGKPTDLQSLHPFDSYEDWNTPFVKNDGSARSKVEHKLHKISFSETNISDVLFDLEKNSRLIAEEFINEQKNKRLGHGQSNHKFLILQNQKLLFIFGGIAVILVLINLVLRRRKLSSRIK